jgi:hypothetical protein
MFALPAFLSAIRRDPLAVSFAALPDVPPEFLCRFRLALRSEGGEQKSAKPRESAKSRKINTYENRAVTLVK